MDGVLAALEAIENGDGDPAKDDAGIDGKDTATEEVSR